MSIFDENNDVEAKLDQQIAEKQELIAAYNKEIKQLKAEIEETNEKYRKKISVVENKRKAFNSEFEKRNNKYSKELKKLEKKQEDFKQTFNNDLAEIDEKIQKLKDKKKALIAKEEELNDDAFKKRKSVIEKNIKNLRDTKVKQTEDFNLQMNELKIKYDALMSEELRENDELEEDLKKLKLKNEEEIKNIEQNIKDIEYKHESALKQLAYIQQEKLDEIRKAKEASINEKRNILNSFNNEIAELNVQKDAYLEELENVKQNNERQLLDIEKSNLEEQTRLLKIIEGLENDLSNKQNDLEQKIIKHQDEYVGKTVELDNLLSLLNTKSADKVDNLKKHLNEVKPQLKSLYEQYLADLDDKFNEHKQILDDELNLLKNNQQEEENQLKNRNEYLHERFVKRERQLKESVDTFARQTDKIKQELANVKQQHRNRVDSLNAKIEKINSENEQFINEKSNEYENQLEDFKNKYDEKLNDIKMQITQVKDDIGGINKDILDLQKEAETYENAHSAKMLDLEKKQESFINNVNIRKEDLLNKITSMQNKVDSSKKEHLEKMEELNTKEVSIRNEYEQKNNDTQVEFDEKIDVLNKNHKNNLQEALQQHNVRLENIYSQYESEINEIKQTFESKKNEYYGAKIKIDSSIDEIEKETENKIKEMQVQRLELLESISLLKVDMEGKQVEYDEYLKQLNLQRDEKLKELANKFEQDKQKVIEDYEIKPKQELSDFRDAFALKQREYNDILNAFSLRKSSIDEQQEEALSIDRQKRSEAENNLNIVESEYQSIKEEADSVEGALNDELTRRQNELDNLKQELDRQLQEIKDRKNEEYEKLNSSLEEEYASYEKQYKEKELEVEKQYEEKAKVYLDDFQVKQNNLQTLINEINERKETTEKQCNDKYNIVVEKTRAIQQELDDLINANELKRNELSSLLNQKQEEIDAEIARINESYNISIEEKKASYDNYINEIRGKCDTLKQEIFDLQKQKYIETAKIEAYENEKRSSIADLEKQTNAFLENIDSQIKLIANKKEELEKVHNNRIVAIKTQIASTMSEYDDFLRVKPEVINFAKEEDTFNLQGRTVAFKEKLDDLEKKHAAILKELEDKHNNTMDQIAKDIEALDVAKTENLKQHEEDIISICNTYDVMIKDEYNKQESLARHIKKATSEQEILLKNMDNQQLTLSTDFEAEKNRLIALHEGNLKQSAQEFKEISKKFKHELDELTSKKSILDSDFAKLAAEYKKIDDDLCQSELKLRYEANVKLLELRKIFENEQNKRKERFYGLDVLSDEDVDVFK